LTFCESWRYNERQFFRDTGNLSKDRTMQTEIQYNFDAVIDRHHTNSVKWDFCKCCFGTEDVLPMWVADMDFMAPPEVIAAIQKAATHGIYGYSEMPDSYNEAITGWTSRRHGWKVDREWLSYTPGVITGLNVAIQTFTRPGDEVVLQSPVYPPFFASIRNNGRRVIDNTLLYDGSEYQIDFDDLEAKITERTRMFALCNPHNPVGRVWKPEELERIAEICLRHDLLIFSDEIHSDLVYPGYRHIPVASLGPEVAERTITGIAPSKTFNIAGLKASVIITSNGKLKEEFDRAQENTFGLYNANIFAITALEAAYAHGEPWLEQLLSYLEENVSYARRFFSRHIPVIQAPQPQGTFLMWLDFSATGLRGDELTEKVFCDARVGMNDGRSFGDAGNGFMRLNIGCPRSVLEEGLNRLRATFG